MSPTLMAKELGVPTSRVSEWKKRGMPMDSADAARAWRMVHAAPRKASSPLKSKAKEAAAPENPADLIPPVEERHKIEGIDDQGEAAGDRANNPYDALRQAKIAEQQANIQRERVAKALLDPIEYGKAQASFIQAQRHRMWMQTQVRIWAREQAITLYVEEAKAIHLQVLQSILRHLDLMGPKVAPRCTDPKTAKDAIEEHVNKIRAAVQDEMEGGHDARSEEA